MKSSLLLPLVVLAASASLVPSPSAAETVPTTRLSSEATVAAPPAKVWSILTTGKNLVTWCPLWKDAANAKISLTKVGDVLDFTDEWGNGGRSIVTYLDPGKELRIVHEPDNGSYMCEAKITLAADGKGTKLTYVEQYTDESSEADRKANAAKTEQEMAATLIQVKAQAEKP